MGDNVEKSLTDRDVQLFFDAAEKLREAAERDGEKARKATAALVSFVNEMSARLQKLEDDVSHKINSSAETTANRAAELLSVNFQQANVAAKRATEQYQEAVENLNFRNWLYVLGTQIVLMLVFIVSILFLVPSLDEVQQRQAELSSLNEQIKNSRLTWAFCEEDKKCFRTDERENGGAPYKDKQDGGTWRVPWKE
ncbi:hypothetical protein [Serratia fonticola]|uniref:Mobilization protein B n=1 Tax=Serratia fonticola TaxID=47917 RepID=A0AAW3WNG4_SERFO|nr:hypothetical protein [Serratia fonticola]MBC3211980.1 hypothetical protein [Serratia fonticola]NYA13541.1 hypothetical protein [Serratia fonticola]NYA33351.1 hypothetical protein [Serratia fonticola]